MRWLALPILALAAAVALAQEPSPPIVRVDAESGPLSARLEVSPPEPALGALVTLSLSATLAGDAPGAPTPATVHWPDVEQLLVEALGEEVVEVERGSRTAGPRSHSLAFRLFDAGAFEVPGLPVKATVPGAEELPELTLAGVTLTVASVVDEEAVPLPSRGALDWERPFELPTAAWFALAAAVLGAAALLWLFLRRRGAIEPERRGPPPPPAHQRALAALEALVARQLPEQGAVEPYFVELSEILRGYVEDRFGLRAPERTTEEFLAEITSTPRGRQAIRDAHRAVLRGFLERADLVKFARDEPDVGVCHDAATTARRFVEDTVPTEPVVEATS